MRDDHSWLRWSVAVLITLIVLFSGVVCIAPASASVTSADRYAVYRAEKPFALDPTLADPRWEAAFTARDFIDLATRGPSQSRTRAAVFYDDKNLYVGFDVQQSTPVTHTQLTNNVGFGLDDFVGIGIDCVGNGERGYWFETTPNGVRYQQANENARFLPVWSAAGTLTPSGWRAMLIVPMSAVHPPNNGPQHWRVNFERYVAATGERDTWAFDSLMANYPVANFPDFREARWWPTATGMVLSGVVPKPKPKAEVYALSATGGDRDVYTTVSGTTYTSAPRHFGVDASYAIQPTVNLVAALSPDFSNVEIDQQTINPQQFRRNFREYRPFFAQGAAYVSPLPENFEFNFAPDQVFYSPSLGPFNRGIKLEGTEGTNSFGVLEAKGYDPTGPMGFDVIAFGFKHKRLNNTLAYWADGVMAHQAGVSDSTFEFGAYGRSLASGLVYAFNHAMEYGTNVANPSQAEKTQALFDIQKAGPFEATIGWNQIGPQYNPIDGFTNIADIKGPNGQLDWVITPKHSTWIKNIELYLYGDRWLDSQGYVHQEDADAYLNLRTKKAVTYNIGYQNGSQRSYGGNYYSGYYNNYADAVTQPYKQPFVGVTLGDGAPNSFAVNYQWGPFGSYYLNQINTTTIYQFRHLSMEFDYAGTYQRPFVAQPTNGQWLRRLTFGLPLGTDGNAAISYRDVSGTGGFGTQGKNLAVGVRKRFRNGNELFVNYGTPAAATTLDRTIVKYLIRLGGGL